MHSSVAMPASKQVYYYTRPSSSAWWTHGWWGVDCGGSEEETRPYHGTQTLYSRSNLHM